MTIPVLLMGAIYAALAPAPLSVAPAALHVQDFSAAGIEVDLVARPSGQDAEAFAARLVEAEGLPDRIGVMTAMSPASGLALKALTGRDGRNVAVYYLPKRPDIASVCRIRARTRVATEARTRASRWCAAQLGVEASGDGLPTFTP